MGKITCLDDLFESVAEYDRTHPPRVPKPEQEQDDTFDAFFGKKDGKALADDVRTIEISKIRMFKDHPFRLYEGERLTDMVDSIKTRGVLVPTIIRTVQKDENGCEYEMLAGHNRLNAAKLAGLTEIPCIIKRDITDDVALMYVVETNVIQRSFNDMLPSEKAKVLSLRHSELFSQGKRNDIIFELKMLENPLYIKENETSGTDFHQMKSRDKVGEEYGLTGRAVANYLRVNELITPLKTRMDDGEITLSVCVFISYLTEAEQQMIEDVLAENEYKLDMKKAELLRSYTGKLTDKLTYQILSGEKAKKAKSPVPAPVKVKHTVYSKYFAPDTKSSEIEKVIDTALAEYFERHKTE